MSVIPLPRNYGLVAVGLQGIFAMLMGLRMTLLRLSGAAGKRPTEQFLVWHQIQLNMAEYHPILMALYATLHLTRKKDEEMSSLEKAAITMGLLSSPIFAYGAIAIPPITLTNPVRVLGGGMRYLAILLLSYLVAKRTAISE